MDLHKPVSDIDCKMNAISVVYKKYLKKNKAAKSSVALLVAIARWQHQNQPQQPNQRPDSTRLDSK